ncbi:uncharacterized protein [Clytia hemisphaerica]|uniref:Uncharacterized protein n=1 Tax=Clytia hemisphaerica TaxID=252671 RepID=A0A7M6DNN3_9CNID
MGNQIGYKRHINNNTLKTSQTSEQQKHILKDFLKMVIKRNQRGGSDKVLVKKDRADAFSSMRLQRNQRRGSRPNEVVSFGERYYRRRRSSSIDASFKFFNTPLINTKTDKDQEMKGKNKFFKYLASSKKKILSRTSSAQPTTSRIEEEEKPWRYYKHSSSVEGRCGEFDDDKKVDMDRMTTFVLTQRFIGWKV